jgi:hypothetical protein
MAQSEDRISAMPIHDWTRVPDGTFHDFHVTWIPLLKEVLNEQVLPPGYYAMAEQVAGVIPDVLTLQAIHDEPQSVTDLDQGGGTALVLSPPQTTISATLEEAAIYAAKANHLVIRHQSGDRVVAMLEVVSAGNKASQTPFDQFVKKSTAALLEGIHLLIFDLHPPTRRDPDGIHGAIWDALGAGQPYRAPPDKPLTLASYSALDLDHPIRAFVEPIAVGDTLPPMPLFLAPGSHVLLPLEESYMSAVSKVPLRARRPLGA